jgi:hypothetical protein
MTAEVFYEPPGAVHPTSRNVSPDKPLKIVVFMVAEKTIRARSTNWRNNVIAPQISGRALRR